MHGPTVLRVCRAVLGPIDADDAWSETFLSAMRAYPDLPADANVEAWLVTIAHRKAIDVTRTATRRARPTAELTDTASVPAVDSHLERAQVDLTTALAQLPPKQRQAIAYHYLGGPTPRSLGSSAAPPTRLAARPPTASRACEAIPTSAYVRPPRNEIANEYTR